MPRRAGPEKLARDRAYSREYYRRNKAEQIARVGKRNVALRAEHKQLLDDYKINRGCVDCGYNKAAIALDFDHLSDKRKCVSAMRGHSPWNIVFEEVQKCEVVCANCHRIRTEQRRNPTVV